MFKANGGMYNRILELFIDLLLARFGMIERTAQTSLDATLLEAIASVIYAAPRIDIKELAMIKEGFAAKFGKDYVAQAIDNKNGLVNERVCSKGGMEHLECSITSLTALWVASSSFTS